MDNKVELKINYWGLGNRQPSEELNNYEEFFCNLNNEFEIKINRGQGGLGGGGLYDFFMELLFKLPLKEVMVGIIANSIYDFTKNKVSIIIENVNQLKEKNIRNGYAERVKVTKLKLEYDDITLYISTLNESISTLFFSQVFIKLIEIIPIIEEKSKLSIKEIHIPIVSVNSLIYTPNREYNFTTIQDIMMKEIKKEEYFKYWGIIFNDESEFFKFDLEKKELSIENWYNY